jgi:hypothetical protein
VGKKKITLHKRSHGDIIDLHWLVNTKNKGFPTCQERKGEITVHVNSTVEEALRPALQ